jgi:hypothetical protein
MPASRIALERRRQIFQALVKLQDHGENVIHSRALIAARFQVTRSQIERIEAEGLEHEWPPLSEQGETVTIADSNNFSAFADEPIRNSASPTSLVA